VVGHFFLDPGRKTDPVTGGVDLEYVGWVMDGQAANGNCTWYCDANSNYFWSGGTRRAS
jgi:hypothetical protein